MTAPSEKQDPSALLRGLNQIFGGRKQRRKIYRRYLKMNGVPKPIFAKVSDRMAFDLANMLTFLEDIRKSAGELPPPKKNGTAL